MNSFSISCQIDYFILHDYESSEWLSTLDQQRTLVDTRPVAENLPRKIFANTLRDNGHRMVYVYLSNVTRLDTVNKKCKDVQSSGSIVGECYSHSNQCVGDVWSQPLRSCGMTLFA